MALPPERITIKRRREDEPVEALYIEQKRHRSNNSYWLRVSDERPFDLPYAPTLRGHLNSATNLTNKQHHANNRKTLPAEDTSSKSPQPSERINRGVQSKVQAAPASTASEKISTRPAEPNLVRTTRDKTESRTRPRTFHLSVSSKTLNSQSTGPKNGIRKHRSRRHDLAVFEEKTKAIMEASQINQRKSRQQPLASADVNIPITERWPKTSSENETASKLQKIGKRTNLSLNEISLQEIKAEKLKDSQLQPQVRFQPKPPKPRHVEDRPSVTDLSPEVPFNGAPHSENQDDFVYDTYLRTTHAVIGSQLDSAMDIDNPELMEVGKVGILIISEQDEAVWETFAEEDDDESDKDWNSEEEDENAEDFYGNDYPEDEVDSDDEYGRGAYQYRSRASDDEDFDEDRDNWSNDENEDEAYS